MKVREIKKMIKEADTFLSMAVSEKDGFLKSMYIKSALAFSWFGLEGTINIALSDFLSVKSTQIHERAFIEEKSLKLNKGEFIIVGTKYNSTEEKLSFLLKRFGGYELKQDSKTWKKFMDLQEWRNSLVHPKESNSISNFTIKHAEESILIAKILITLIYRNVYKKKVFF